MPFVTRPICTSCWTLRQGARVPSRFKHEYLSKEDREAPCGLCGAGLLEEPIGIIYLRLEAEEKR